MSRRGHGFRAQVVCWAACSGGGELLPHTGIHGALHHSPTGATALRSSRCPFCLTRLLGGQHLSLTRGAMPRAWGPRPGGHSAHGKQRPCPAQSTLRAPPPPPPQLCRGDRWGDCGASAPLPAAPPSTWDQDRDRRGILRPRRGSGIRSSDFRSPSSAVCQRRRLCGEMTQSKGSLWGRSAPAWNVGVREHPGVPARGGLRWRLPAPPSVTGKGQRTDVTRRVRFHGGLLAQAVFAAGVGEGDSSSEEAGTSVGAVPPGALPMQLAPPSGPVVRQGPGQGCCLRRTMGGGLRGDPKVV